MRTLAKGKQATVYLDDTGRILWVANKGEGSRKQKHVMIGWQLCKERLSPPHFPKIYYLTKYLSWPAVCMEYVTGKKPSQWNGKQARIILEGLKKANIFHRDIRLEHIVERPTGEWCLIDFGFACDYNNVWTAPKYLGTREYQKRPGVQDDAHAMKVVKRLLEKLS